MLHEFKNIDADHDGQISRSELRGAYKKYYAHSLNDEEMSGIMNQLDQNKSGYIDYSEFVMAVIDKEKVLNEKNLKTAFNLIDADHNGGISLEELKHFFENGSKNVTEAEWKALFREADENKDGVISLSEFKNMMLQILN